MRIDSLRRWAVHTVSAALGMLATGGSLTPVGGQQEVSVRKVADVDLVDLRDLLSFTDSSWVDGGLFLADGRLAFIDGVTQKTYFVDVEMGSLVAAGGVGYESVPITALVGRLPDGGAVTVNGDRTLVFFTADGSVQSSASVDIAQSKDVVGVFPDGTVAIRNASGAGMSQRGEVEYRTLAATGRTAFVAKIPGDETAVVSVSDSAGTTSGQFRQIFGHRTFAGVAGGVLIIAQSDADFVLLFDSEGQPSGRIPMPPQRDVEIGEADVSAQRSVRLLERRRTNRARRHALLTNERFSSIAREMLRTDSLFLWEMPVSDVLPPIDRLVADASGRLWIRVAALPSESMACWQVWHLTGSAPRLDRTVLMARSAQLLDARDEMVLLRLPSATRDESRDHIVIRTMLPPLDLSEEHARNACSDRSIRGR